MKAICTTTINPVTEALHKFVAIAERDDWMIYISGDHKTPHSEYHLLQQQHPDHVRYLTPEMQEGISKELSDAIGWKCIQRRNMSILEAYRDGAEIMALVDDDNIPYDFWGQDLLVGKEGVTVEGHMTSMVVFDPLMAVKDTPYDLWHRGFPIQLLPDKRRTTVELQSVSIPKILVQADLWNGDPDIDAVCRIANAPEVEFMHGTKPFTSNRPMPFNSQNTFIHRDILPTYFLFPHVGRMDDIWAAYMAQYKFPGSVVFNRPSVYQARNPHDLSKDLEAELLGYKHTIDFVEYLFNGDPEGKKFPDWFPIGAVEAYRIWKKVLKDVERF